MAKENRAYKFRIYPNKEQTVMFARTFGCCRFIYNRMLTDKIAEYERSGKMLNNTPAMYKEEFPWLREVDSLALANVQLHLQKAYKQFFLDPSTGFPRFKSRGKSRDSYTTNVVNGNIALCSNRLKLPKIGKVRIKCHREIPEDHRIKSVTISREASGKYYASILTEYQTMEGQAEEKTELNILGMDYAMRGMAVLSDGTCLDYPGYYRKAQEKLAREQRKLSRCKKGSRNYEKQKLKLARCHDKVKNQRRDYQHKQSRKLAEKYDVIAIEDLNMKDMSKSLHFGKSVMDNSYGMFTAFLKVKLTDRGKRLIKVNRYYPSSKTCSRCGRVKEKLDLSERVYRCQCGLEIDRDVNAAKNIRNEAIRMLTA